MLEGLALLQANGIVYRDIDLSNLLLTDENIDNSHLKLANFPLFRSLWCNSIVHHVTGNPLYLAPEVFNGEEWGWKGDTWALGVVMFEVLTGGCAFQSESVADLRREMREGVVFVEGGVGREAKEAVFCMMRYSPDVRPSLDSLRSLPFFSQSSPSLPPTPLHPLLDFDLIEVDESYPDLALQYLDIPSSDDNSPLSASLLGEDVNSVFIKAVLEVDSELQQSEEWGKLADTYERRKEYGVAIAVWEGFSRLLTVIRKEVETVNGKRDRPHPLVAHLLERLFLLTTKAQDRISSLKESILTASLTDGGSVLILESVIEPPSDTVITLEIQRLVQSSHEPALQHQQLKPLKDALKLGIALGGGEEDRVIRTVMGEVERVMKGEDARA